MESYLDLVLGKHTIKSMTISSHFHSNTCNGYNNLAGC
jgi:hypothetical protein